MNKEIIIDIPVYKFKIYAWICSPKQANKRFNNTWYFDQGHQTSFVDYGGKCLFTSEPYDPIIWVDGSKELTFIISALAHETLHAIIYELGKKGCNVEIDNHEFYTYLQEYVMLQILEQSKLLSTRQLKQNKL